MYEVLDTDLFAQNKAERGVTPLQLSREETRALLARAKWEEKSIHLLLKGKCPAPFAVGKLLITVDPPCPIQNAMNASTSSTLATNS